MLAFHQKASTLLLGLLLTHFAAAIQDASTGISFPPTLNGLGVFGVGVRRKGPIKVYSVAMYTAANLKEKLAGLSKSSDKKKALSVLQNAKNDGDVTFLLEMNFKVGAEKMASAIAESVAPRHSGDSKEVDQLKGLIFDGVLKKGAATKGTKFQFECSSSGVGVCVDGAKQGTVSSSSLGKSFCDVYLDDKTVSPALRENILDLNCAP